MLPALVKETLTSRKDTLVEECELGISSWENHIYVLLKGHRHGDFAARWAKPLKYLAKKKTIMCF